MSFPSGMAKATVKPAPSRGASTRLHGQRRVLVSAGVGAVALLSLGTFLIRLQAFIIHVQTACTGPPCAYGQLTYTEVETLQRIGLSLAGYAPIQITIALLWGVLCLAVVALIAWRKSDDWMALLVVGLLVLWPTALVIGTYSVGTYTNSQGHQFPAPLVNFLARFGFFLVFALFPNGRFVSRWILVPLGVYLAEEVSYNFLSTWPLRELPGWVGQFAILLWLATLLSLVPIQWYRYRHTSSAIERQQIKWAVFGISIVSVGFTLRPLLALLIPTLNQPGSLYNSLSTPILICVSMAIALSIGLAILRYRLWDVDVLINKALVYGLLTGTLAAVYAGLIIGLESLVGRFTVQAAQPLVIVISTLAIAGLFHPLRRRIQHLIDRRLYRKKYDAAKTLATFSSTLRNEVDLEQLSAHLIDVVNETLHPAHVSLWLFPPERHTEEHSLSSKNSSPKKLPLLSSIISERWNQNYVN